MSELLYEGLSLEQVLEKVWRERGEIEYPMFDYEKQAWVEAPGVYSDCGHPAGMGCVCYGRAHAGEAIGEATRKHLLEQIADQTQ